MSSKIYELVLFNNIFVQLFWSSVGSFFNKKKRHAYNAAKVIADYLEPLCQNGHKINDTQSFPFMLKDQAPLNPNEEYVSYYVEALFANIPVYETINYIINEIYQKKKLPQNCSKTIFKRLWINDRSLVSI